jgi:hypothetical protein
MLCRCVAIELECVLAEERSSIVVEVKVFCQLLRMGHGTRSCGGCPSRHVTAGTVAMRLCVLLLMASAAAAATTNGWLATYHRGHALNGHDTPGGVLRRVDSSHEAVANVPWGTATDYSVVWSGYFVPEETTVSQLVFSFNGGAIAMFFDNIIFDLWDKKGTQAMTTPSGIGFVAGVMYPFHIAYRVHNGEPPNFRVSFYPRYGAGLKSIIGYSIPGDVDATQQFLGDGLRAGFFYGLSHFTSNVARLVSAEVAFPSPSSSDAITFDGSPLGENIEKVNTVVMHGYVRAGDPRGGVCTIYVDAQLGAASSLAWLLLNGTRYMPDVANTHRFNSGEPVPIAVVYYYSPSPIDKNPPRIGIDWQCAEWAPVRASIPKAHLSSDVLLGAIITPLTVRKDLRPGLVARYMRSYAPAAPFGPQHVIREEIVPVLNMSLPPGTTIGEGPKNVLYAVHFDAVLLSVEYGSYKFRATVTGAADHSILLDYVAINGG